MLSSEKANRVRVIAWTVPRSASTVFMKSITANGDVKGYLEPFTTAEHFGPEGRLKPREEVPAEPTYTVEAVKEWLEAEDTSERSVFVKDLAYAVDGRYHVMPKGYRYSFLIRKPISVFKSYYRLFSRMPGDPEQNLKDWLPKDVNIFKCLSDLVGYVESTLKEDFCIIDSEDIMKNPAEMMKKYCDKVGLIYNEGLLHWEQGLPEEETWVVGDAVRAAEADFKWMENMTKSTGWGVGINHPPVQGEEFPKVVYDLAEAALPYYDHCRNHAKCINLDQQL
ncbi:uncharacterized protein [Amphiura filiformis]|uniref:uncharacterized protein n=1 Tax=Amphiura filiformis TaxID=82378 RepID=UPI003B2289B8